MRCLGAFRKPLVTKPAPNPPAKGDPKKHLLGGGDLGGAGGFGLCGNRAFDFDHLRVSAYAIPTTTTTAITATRIRFAASLCLTAGRTSRALEGAAGDKTIIVPKIPGKDAIGTLKAVFANIRIAPAIQISIAPASILAL